MTSTPKIALPAAWACACIATAIGVSACSSQQLYAAGQGWQRQECVKLPDLAQRERCMSSAARSYDDYRRDASAAPGAK